MAELYDTDRVTRIGKIARRFATACRVGDEIEFGLKGDPAFPPEYESSRPTGKIIRVKNEGTDNASIRVRLTSGKVVDVMPHTVDPKRVWEFTDDTFPKVLARHTRAPASEPAPAYRNSAEPGSYEALLQKVEALQARLDDEIRENRSFNGALVSSLNEMAGEVSKVNPNSAFCQTFTSEYSDMMRGRALPPPEASPFDSDFTDSDVD